MVKLSSGILRYVLTALAVALALAASATYRSGQKSRDELVAILVEAGLDQAADRVAYERTTHHARVLAARALVHHVLAAVEPGTGDEDDGALRIGTAEWEAAVDRLPLAAAEARRVLRVQPNSWQAMMLLGATTYLERSHRRDRRLFTAAHEWEDLLWAAVAEAPGQPEPRRVLAAAYLEVWTALAPAKKEKARELLKESFERHWENFQLLLPAWLQVAADREEVFEVIPDSASAWDSVAKIYGRRGDWEAFCEARRRHRERLWHELGARLDEAEQRLRLGEFFHSRSLLLDVVRRSPRDTRFAPLVARAFERYPAGLHGLKSTEHIGSWLRWTLSLHTAGHLPLPPAVISRLAGAAGGLEPHDKALAVLISGELHYSESLERATDSLSIEPWGPYLLAKTRWFLERQRLREASETLDLVDSATAGTPAYALARLELARARGLLVEVTEAEQALGEHKRREWSAEEWRWLGHNTSLVVLPEVAATGLAIRLNRVRDQGTVIEVHWDGQPIAVEVVAADGELEISYPVSAELHLLEVRMLAGGRLYPGRVRLLLAEVL